MRAFLIAPIAAVDDLSDGEKFRNLADLEIADYIDHPEFYIRFADGDYGPVECVFHEGACSDTMETDGRYMMANNFEVSKNLFLSCQNHGSRLLYASSAATYGGSEIFIESPDFERPLNVYGYSKLLFDQWVRRQIGTGFDQSQTQVAGFRYFNVYGPREQHKGRMASVAFHQHHQYLNEGRVKLFGAYGGYEAGEQKRDFVFVDDVVAVNLWFFDHPERSGLFNLGSGRAQPFNDVALSVVNAERAVRSEAALTLAQAVQADLIKAREQLKHVSQLNLTGAANDPLERLLAASSQVLAAADLVRSQPHQSSPLHASSMAEDVFQEAHARLVDALHAQEPIVDPDAIALLDELVLADSQARFARGLFNEAAQAFNQARLQWPTRVVARVFGFQRAGLLSLSPSRLEGSRPAA